MLLGFPYSKFTVRKHENIYRGQESFLQGWPDLSDPTVCEGVLLLESECGKLRSDASASSDVFVIRLLLGLGGLLSLRSVPLLTSSFSESCSSLRGVLAECSTA